MLFTTAFRLAYSAIYLVEWVNASNLLNSAEDVHGAYYGGDLSLTRAPEADFKCPA